MLVCGLVGGLVRSPPSNSLVFTDKILLMVVLGKEGTEGMGGELRARKKSLASLILESAWDWTSVGAVLGMERGGRAWLNMGLGVTVAAEDLDLWGQEWRTKVGEV